MSQQAEDQQLIAKILAGSEDAFAGLMQRHERTVFRICFAFTRDQDDAMDVTQEIFLRVHEKLPTYGGSGSFRGWLLQLSRNACRNWLRRHERHRGHVELSSVAGSARVTAPAVQDVEALRREQRDKLQRELDSLSPRQYHAVSLRYFEHLPIRDVAAALDCSEGVAKSILFRSLDRIRRRLSSEWRPDHEHL